jgi:hypothetical protein
VQDLIHPSLYPFVRGRSYTTAALPVSAAGADKKQGDDDDHYDEENGDQELGFDAEKEREYNAQAKELEGLDSIYQWLPAEFDVSPEGEVEIVSYINNLDSVRHGVLYETIAHAFRLFLPLFAQVLGGGDSRVYGRRLQVIVKAANYLVAPNARYEGSWHVEGMKHERIVASGIYYYSTTPNLPDTCLAFRDQRHNSMADRERSYNTSFNINLGKVDTPAGRCLAFTNSFQHRVKGVENKSSSETGVRKILCFFLIDPDNRYVPCVCVCSVRTRLTPRTSKGGVVGGRARAAVGRDQACGDALAHRGVDAALWPTAPSRAHGHDHRAGQVGLHQGRGARPPGGADEGAQVLHRRQQPPVGALVLLLRALNWWIK